MQSSMSRASRLGKIAKFKGKAAAKLAKAGNYKKIQLKPEAKQK